MYGELSMGPAIAVLAITVLFFILGRELLCWYWKINRVVELLESIEANTRKANTIAQAVKEEPNKTLF